MTSNKRSVEICIESGQSNTKPLYPVVYFSSCLCSYYYDKLTVMCYKNISKPGTKKLFVVSCLLVLV
jgi:hypothetical protein